MFKKKYIILFFIIILLILAAIATNRNDRWDNLNFGSSYEDDLRNLNGETQR